MRYLSIAFVALALVLTGCGRSGSSSDAQSSSTTVDRTVTLHPKKNLLEYRETEFTVAPGETIKLVFENTATSPSMLHNVVVLNTEPTKEVLWRVGEAGVAAGEEQEYVPDDPAVRAYTPMADPGETVSVTFTVPKESGDYGYVCTFPGHYVSMYGTMHVRSDPPS
jgi:azurin